MEHQPASCHDSAEDPPTSVPMKRSWPVRIWLATVMLAAVVAWVIPSNVVELIARDRQTILGRYSQTHFTWNVVGSLIALVILYIDSAHGRTKTARRFRVLAVLFVVVPAVALLDYVMRPPGDGHYVRDTVAYHRPAGSVFHIEFVDRPQATRTYPNAPPGYGTVSCTATTDANGFRNRGKLDRYDVVVLGDSFAEGSSVSDEHAWPARLASATGLSVYNLGMSGYDPSLYLASLKEYGLALKPRMVICLVYEGNDFRSAKADRKRAAPSFSKRVQKYFKRSPVVDALDRTVIDTLSSIRSRGHVPGVELLDWLPLAVPPGSQAKYYALQPKQLRDAYRTSEEFAVDRHWLNPRRQLSEMKEACESAGCRLIVAYAPTKAYVMLPPVAERLPAEKVRAFMSLRYRKALPEPDQFLKELLNRLGARERVVRTWCKRESIPFIRLTGALRDRAMRGVQVYYTYDQHWTPEGHEVVADRVARSLADLAADRRANAGGRGEPHRIAHSRDAAPGR